MRARRAVPTTPQNYLLEPEFLDAKLISERHAMICQYINLDEATARRDWMETSFAAMGLSASRMRAVRIDEIPDRDPEVNIGNLMRRPWIEAEIACFLSHRECWKRIAAGDEPFGAVFEDDVHFAPGAPAFLRDSSWIPAGVELVKLETILSKTLLSRQALAAQDRLLRRLDGLHLGAAAYVLSRPAAQQLLARSRQLDVPVDHLIFNPAQYGLRFAPWQLCPAICIQDDRLTPDATRLGSQISETYRGLTPRPKPKSLLGKVHRELTRPLKQAARLLQDPARLVQRPRQIVPFR